mgnify:CR=1 FL=1
MIKKVLFISALFCIEFVAAQSFKLLDYNNVDISNTTHYEYGTKEILGETKFHVSNLTGSQRAFAVKVEKVYTPYSNSNLSVCFGPACFSADATINGTQIINNGTGDQIDQNAIYTDLKLAPITWPWLDCSKDSAVWKVTMYDPMNVTDETTATVVWRCGYPVAIKELSEDLISLNSYPNPASVELNINYKIEATFNSALVVFYDMLGQKLFSKQLTTSKGKVILNVEHFNAGLYFYAIEVDGITVKTLKVLVK